MNNNKNLDEGWPDDPANAQDPILQKVDPTRRQTLIARRRGDTLTWDIILQGENETVFFDV